MAKISARGDTEQARWRANSDSTAAAPFEMVLTVQGRLLYKAQRGETFSFRRRGVSLGTAVVQADIFKMGRV